MTLFAETLKENSRHKFTENGERAFSTTKSKLVDLFGTIGALRTRNEASIIEAFKQAYAENPLLATKMLFYARDIREGCGERRTFRIILKWLAEYHPEAVRPNLDLIGVYGRYDDLYSLIDTPVEKEMWTVMKKQLLEDIENYKQGNAISLLAKWIKTPDASSKTTRALGIKTAIELGYSVYDFKRILRKLRKHLKVVETYMSAGQWDKITYPTVPSRAMMLYRKAFFRQDEERYKAYIEDLKAGKTEVKSATLYPYDIIEKLWDEIDWWGHSTETAETKETVDLLEAQWKALPDYVGEEMNAIVMADTSGSMAGRPMMSSIGLGIYFAERNKGAYHNLFMTFAEEPAIVSLRDEMDLCSKIKTVKNTKWGMNTDMEAAFDKILNVAIDNHIPQNEMVKALIVISDMEFDEAIDTRDWETRMSGKEANDNWSFYDRMAEKYARAGYTIPNVIFWNVNARNDTFHTDADKAGVQLVSGQSTTTFKHLMKALNTTPYELMIEVLELERYAPIQVA